MTSTPEQVIAKIREAYDKVASWPEDRMSAGAVVELGPGFLDLLELRNLVPALLDRVEAVEAEIDALRKALEQPFCVLFLDGRNEHGSHVLPSFPRSFDPAETNIEDEAETILSAAEGVGFAVGDHVWAEFTWNPPQIGDEGRIEFVGYWEFQRINVELSKAIGARTLLAGDNHE